MSVSVSPISRLASVLIVIVGLFSLLVGQAVKNTGDTVSGIAFVILGIVLYALLATFSRKTKGK